MVRGIDQVSRYKSSIKRATPPGDAKTNQDIRQQNSEGDIVDPDEQKKGFCLVNDFNK